MKTEIDKKLAEHAAVIKQHTEGLHAYVQSAQYEGAWWVVQDVEGRELYRARDVSDLVQAAFRNGERLAMEYACWAAGMMRIEAQKEMEEFMKKLSASLDTKSAQSVKSSRTKSSRRRS